MHELNIAARIATRTREEKDHQRWDQVNQVHLEIGSLSGVDPDALTFAFEALVAETDLSGCRLEIASVSPICLCRDCSARFDVEGLTFALRPVDPLQVDAQRLLSEADDDDFPV